MLTSQEIETYLEALNAELDLRQIHKPVRVLVVGGAYMLAFIGNRAATKDVDIIPLSFPDTMHQDNETKAFRAAVYAVARSYRMKRDWLNDVVAAFAPEPGPLTLWLRYASLHVYVPSSTYILALKLLAGRERDEDDIVILCERLGIQTREQAQRVVDQYADQNWQRECNLQMTLDALFD